MGTIETTIDQSKDLTVVTATGKMEAADFLEWISSYYNGPVTKLVLWDVSQADFSIIQAEDMRGGAAITQKLSDARRGGKTAIVSKDTLGFGVSRMLEAFYELEGVPFEVQAFHTIDEAMEWLGA